MEENVETRQKSKHEKQIPQRQQIQEKELWRKVEVLMSIANKTSCLWYECMLHKVENVKTIIVNKANSYNDSLLITHNWNNDFFNIN